MNTRISITIGMMTTLILGSMLVGLLGAQLLAFGLERSSSRVPPIVYDKNVQIEYQKQADAARLEGVSVEHALQPLAKVDRFVIWQNDATGNYAISLGRDIIVLEITEGDETDITYFGRSHGTECTLTYRNGTDELLRCAYLSNSDGGLLHGGSVKSFYLDSDADGRIDWFTDYQARVRYAVKEVLDDPQRASNK